MTKTLAIGKMGRVLLAQHLHSGVFYAVKRLRKKDINKLNEFEHVNSERDILQDIDHHLLISY